MARCAFLVVLALFASCGGPRPALQKQTTQGGSDRTGQTSAQVPELLEPAPQDAEPQGLAADPFFGPLVVHLEELSTLKKLALFELDAKECDGGKGRRFLISSPDGEQPASCVGDGARLLSCAAFAGFEIEHLRHVLCQQKSVPLTREAPAWARSLVELVNRTTSIDSDLFVQPVGRAEVNALWMGSRSGFRHHVGVLSPRGWRWAELHLLNELSMYQSVEVFDSSAATEMTSFAVSSEAYDGGSGQGERRAELEILVLREDGLEEAGRFSLAYLFWSWSRAEKTRVLRKRRGSKGMSLRDRPHVEAALQPTVGDGTLSFAATIRPGSRMAKKYSCTEEEVLLADLNCPMAEISKVLAGAGDWIWNGSRFEKAGGGGN